MLCKIQTHTKHWGCHNSPLELTIFSCGSKPSPQRVQNMVPKDIVTLSIRKIMLLELVTTPKEEWHYCDSSTRRFLGGKGGASNAWLKTLNKTSLGTGGSGIEGLEPLWKLVNSSRTATRLWFSCALCLLWSSILRLYNSLALMSCRTKGSFVLHAISPDILNANESSQLYKQCHRQPLSAYMETGINICVVI